VVSVFFQVVVILYRVALVVLYFLDYDVKRRYIVSKLRALRVTFGRGSASERTARIALEMIEASSSGGETKKR